MRQEKEIIWSVVIAVSSMYLFVAVLAFGLFKLDTDYHDEDVAETIVEATLLRAKSISESVVFQTATGDGNAIGKLIEWYVLDNYLHTVAVLVIDREGKQLANAGSLAGSPAITQFAKGPRSAGQTQIDLDRGLFLARTDIRADQETQSFGTLVLVEDHNMVLGANSSALEMMAIVLLGGFVAIVVLLLLLARRPIPPPRDPS